MEAERRSRVSKHGYTVSVAHALLQRAARSLRNCLTSLCVCSAHFLLISGHTSAPQGGVFIDLTRMQAIRALHVDDMDVVVEPGLSWNNLNAELKKHGLFYPVDPGPGASLGGMVATNCSGTNAVRYGTMKANVLNLTVVLPDGE